jgi:hypothetical protein
LPKQDQDQDVLGISNRGQQSDVGHRGTENEPRDNRAGIPTGGPLVVGCIRIGMDWGKGCQLGSTTIGKQCKKNTLTNVDVDHIIIL